MRSQKFPEIGLRCQQLIFKTFTKVTYIVENSTDVLVPQARAAAVHRYKWETVMVCYTPVTVLLLRDFSHCSSRVGLVHTAKCNLFQ